MAGSSPTPRPRPQAPSSIATARNDIATARNDAAPQFAWKAEAPAPAANSPTFAWKDTAAPAPPADPIGPKAPAIPQSEALARGIRSGTTFGWGDEITAAEKASGLPSSRLEGFLPPLIRAPLTAARVAVGAGRQLAGDKDASSIYENTRDEERFRGDEARKQHPGTSLAGEVVGGLAIPLPGATTGRLGMVALKGAGYGALTSAISAAGESKDGIDPTSTAIGAGVGAGLGGSLPYAGRLLSWIAGKPINTVRNLAVSTGRRRARGRAGSAGGRSDCCPRGGGACVAWAGSGA